MLSQSTNHILMIEPVDFYDNPETKTTNAYQVEKVNETREETQATALKEFRAYRDQLVAHGVTVTTLQGQKGCPDDVFPNWLSTHAGGRLTLYPMYNDNRRRERRPDIVDFLKRYYPQLSDYTAFEAQGKAFEANGAACLDRVHKIAYSNLSARSDEEVAKKWASDNGYDLVRFETEHRGMPVYHADIVMWIGTDLCGICSECLKTDGVVERLKKNRDVVEFTSDQMDAFAGNALEVLGHGGERMLAMSVTAWDSLRSDQIDLIHRHYKTVIRPDIHIFERLGGGSARCMMVEMF